MREIIVPAGERATVESGAVRLSLLEIHEDATLVFSDSTTLFVDRLVTHSGARIVYESDAFNDDAVFTLNVLDASKVEDLRFVGNGKAGSGFAPAARARDGGSGRDARNCKLSDPDGRKAKRGGRGADGAAGGDAEDAVDFVLHLPNVPPGARINIESIGGRGGDGQNGGNGGRGGHRSNCRDGQHGGDGGNGGPGGDGGDAGKLMLFVVVPDDVYRDRAASNAAIETIKLEPNTAPGERGSGGGGGVGGRAGRSAHVGAGRSRDGRPGADGPDGSAGDGPRPGSTNLTSWVTVDVMATSAYQQFIAQQLATLRVPA